MFHNAICLKTNAFNQMNHLQKVKVRVTGTTDQTQYKKRVKHIY